MDVIPFDGFELRPPAPDIFGGDEAVTPAPHYFSPLADWHLKNLANRAIVEAKAAYLYLAVDRPKNAVNGWYVTGEKVYLTLDEAKQHGESRYKVGHMVRVYTCPALVFITDEHYFPVLDLNTPNPFSGLHRLVVDERGGLPKTIGKLAKLLAATERSQGHWQWFLTGVMAKEHLEFEGLALDTVRKPSCLAYTRQHVKIRRTARGVPLPESTPAKARRQEEAKWVRGSWEVSDEYLFLVTRQ